MPTASTPLFSVIIPTYNREHFITQALQSVLAQSYEDFEVIVIDDGSDDSSQEKIAQFEDARIHYVYQKNHGVAHARNRGLKQARGRFIAFLDSDDKWAAQKLERCVDYIQKFPDISIFHTEELWYRSQKLFNQKKKHKKPTGFVYLKALELCCISISTAVIKKEIFQTLGAFDEEFAACEDYDFWLRATLQNEVKLIPENLTIKDGGRPDQLSARVWGLDRFRIKALAKMLSQKNLSKNEYALTLQALKKKCHFYLLGAKKRGKNEEITFYNNLMAKAVKQIPFNE